jgi:hypothetical protein
MPVFQHYYTSCQTSKMSGFQVKAQSMGLSPDAAKTLEKLISYQIPITSDVRNLASHPIALRYYATEQEAILISSQSNGDDELGRPGNFFAHSIVATPAEIANAYAPIFYWKNPFWVSQDKSSTEILPTLSEFNPEITFDFDAIWEFIQTGNRQECLYKLLCAVLDYPNSQRRIIILDEIESTVLWIAAISIALLPKYSQVITFATYHHDPYRVPFLITGTTSDSNFRLSNDEYISYFVVNNLDGRISDVPDSDYAKYLVDNLNPENYDTQIIEFFNWLDSLKIVSQFPNNILDYCVNFYLATIQSSLSPQSKKALLGAKTIIAIISQKSSFTSEDISNLQLAWKLLGQEMVREATIDIIENVINGLKTLKRTDENFPLTCADALDLLIQLVLKKSLSPAQQFTSSLYNLYSQELVIKNLSYPHVLNRLATHLSERDWEQLIIFWKYLGKDIYLNANNEICLKIILEKTFSALNCLQCQNELYPPKEGAELLSNLLMSHKISYDFILNCAANYQSINRTALVLQWLYYAIVEKLSYQQRASEYWKYWQSLGGIYPQLYQYELKRDILRVKTIQEQIDVVKQWVNIINSKDQPLIIRDFINFIWGLPKVDHRELSSQLLSKSELVENIDLTLYQQIVQAFLVGVKIHKPDGNTLKAYQLILNDSQIQISQNKQAIIKGVIDLVTGKLQDSTIPELKTYFGRVSATTYEEEVKELMSEFFTNRYDCNSHLKLVSAVYQNRYSEIFWNLYWEVFLDCLLEKQKIHEILEILDFWFNSSGSSLDNYHYVIPEFFTELPSILSEIIESKSYRKINKDFEKKIQNKRWYPVIQKYLKKNKGFFGLI